MSYEFRPKTESQKAVMEDTSPCLLYCAPWFSGKTHVGAVKAYIMGAKYRNNCIGLVRKKRVDLKPTLWRKFIDILPSEVVIDSNDTELYRKIVNGTEFYGVGLDSTQDVNKLASREYGFIVVEEIREISKTDFETKLLRCLRLPTVPFHQLLGLTNADSPMHFLYKDFYMESRDGFKAIDGEMLPDPPPNYKKLLNSLTGIYRQRFIENKWVSFEGLVYPFDPRKHVVTRSSVKISSDGRWVISMDFGFDHPTVVQWWYVSPDDAWYLYYQIYHSYRIVSKHAVTIKEYCAKLNIEPKVICDHDAEDAATLRDCGIKTTPAQKARLPGQKAVYEKFEGDKIFFVEDSLIELDQRLLTKGKPDEKYPTRTEEEFPTYTWANTAKEDMVKEKDDGMDAARYGIYTGEPIKPVTSWWI